MKMIALISLILFSTNSMAYSFDEALKMINTHSSIQSLEGESKALKSEGEMKGSWGDPMFKVSAKNFPKDSLKDNETPMTGIEFGVSQKFALSTKYGKIQNAYNKLSGAKDYESIDRQRELVSSFWGVLISSRRIREELSILNENLNWLKNTLKVSKWLYSTGKTSQQALLEIEIRKSEIEALISNKEFELKEQEAELSYLLGLKGKIVESTIPWKLLDRNDSNVKDLKELALKSKLEASQDLLNASKLNYIPDITFSVGYTKRSNIDDNGDFLGASISFPIPVSSSKYSEVSKASFDKYKAKKNLITYQQLKTNQEEKVIFKIKKIDHELNILQNKTIKFAQNSREIISKSYSLGEATYLEILQAELKLQTLLLNKSVLRAELAKNKIFLKFLRGENLNG